MAYGQNPKCFNNGCLGAKFRIGMCQTTISRRLNRNKSTAQVSG
nr:MAG TPA: HTH-type transcriptional regulator [Caudoviricetes sp.]